MGRIVGGANGLSSGLVGGKSYQRFTASGDWIKPAGASFITFEMIGAGGGGGGSGNAEAGGGGGGGASTTPACGAAGNGGSGVVIIRYRFQ